MYLGTIPYGLRRSTKKTRDLRTGDAMSNKTDERPRYVHVQPLYDVRRKNEPPKVRISLNSRCPTKDERLSPCKYYGGLLNLKVR